MGPMGWRKLTIPSPDGDKTSTLARCQVAASLSYRSGTQNSDLEDPQVPIRQHLERPGAGPTKARPCMCSSNCSLLTLLVQ